MSNVRPIRTESEEWTGRAVSRAEGLRPAKRARAALFGARRRVITGVGVLLVAFFAWHVVFGRNGVNNYERKRAQDHALQHQIQSLRQENTRLASRVSHLQNDPDEIEFEATKKLHYVRPGEIIYKLNEAPQSSGN